MCNPNANIFQSVLVGTNGSNPSSSTGMTNSDSLPSYALTICECAFLICFNYYCNSAINSFFNASVSSKLFDIEPSFYCDKNNKQLNVFFLVFLLLSYQLS